MRSRLSLAALTAVLFVATPRTSLAHCDTIDGPVVEDARLALELGDPVPALKWVRVQDEPVIRAALERALAVRSLGPDAGQLADLYFFETLVRVHRAGEGAPFAGLKPAGSELEPGVAAADDALESGVVDRLLRMATDHVARSLRERYQRAAAARRHASESVAQGREYVAAYVEFVHYAEGLMTHSGAGAHAQHEVEKPAHSH